MILTAADRVQEFAQNIAASGSITLLGATAADLITFAQGGLNGKTVPYTIEHEASDQWEIGLGVYTASGTTLTRAVVLANSSGTTVPINFAAGVVNVWVDLPAEKAVMYDADTDHVTLRAGLSIAGAFDGVTTVHASGAVTLDNAALSIRGVAYTWPATQAANRYLKTDGAGNLTWATILETLALTDLSDVTITTPSAGQMLAYNGAGLWINSSDGTALTISASNLSTGTVPTGRMSGAYAGITGLGTVASGTWNASVIVTTYGGTGLSTWTAGDVPYYASGTALSKLGIGTAAQFFNVNAGGTAPQWHTLVTADVTDLTSAATGITKVGTVTTGVWNATVVTTTYGGTGLSTYAVGDILYFAAGTTLTKLPIGTTLQYLRTNAGATAPEWHTLTAADIGSGQALTKGDDTNVTLTLGGTPGTALLVASSITAGWTGTLAAARLNANVVQAVTNDTNVTGSIATQTLTLGWTGTLAAGRLNANVVQAITNDTNVTGSITAQNLTLAWSGQLGVARGGTGLATFTAAGGTLYATAGTTLAVLAIGTAAQYYRVNAGATAPEWHTITAGDITAGQALTKADDTNVTLTLGGTPATALLAAASITAGWTGTLAAARLNANVVQSFVNDTNVTASIAAQVATLGWTGTLAAARLNANVVQSVVNDTNVTGSISAQALTLGWTSTLAVGRGGTGLSTFTAAGGMAYATAATTLTVLAIGAANTVMTSTGSAPQWSTSLNLAGSLAVATTSTLTGTVAIGAAGGTAGASQSLQVFATGGPLWLMRSSANAAGTNISIVKSRGATAGSLAALVAGDAISILNFLGVAGDGSTVASAAQISVDVPTSGVATTTVAGQFTFLTTNLAGTQAIRLKLSSEGVITPGADNTYALGTGALRWSDFQSVTGTFGGLVTFNATGNAWVVSAALARTAMTSTTGTNASYHGMTNTGGSGYVGLESSVGGGIFTGSSAYSLVLYTSATQDIQLIRGGVLGATVGSGGAVTFPTAGPTSIILGVDGSVSGGMKIWNASAASREGNIYGDATYSIRLDTNSNARPIRIDGSALSVSSAATFLALVTGAVSNAVSFDANSAGVSKAGYRWSTNSTTRWDVVTPSGSTSMSWQAGGSSEVMSLTSAGLLTASSTIISGSTTGNTAFQMTSGARFYIDGGGDTYVRENAANTWRFLSGGAAILDIPTTGPVILTGLELDFNNSADNNAGSIKNAGGSGSTALTVTSSRVTFSGAASFGTNPNATASLGVANNQSLGSRNAANSADVDMIFLNASDVVVIGDSTHAVKMPKYGAGAATFDASGNITSVSDERHKTDIRSFGSGLRELRNVRPILHRYNERSGMETEHTYPGFSAQNVREFLPEAIFERASDGMLSLYDRGILAALVNAVKELDTRTAALAA